MACLLADRLVGRRCHTPGVNDAAAALDSYYAALSWVQDLMGSVTFDLLDRATPCPEFTVRMLMGHLVGTAERGLATAQGRPNGPIPHVITDVPDADLARRYAVLGGQLRTAWSGVELHETVEAPWGRRRLIARSGDSPPKHWCTAGISQSLPRRPARPRPK